MKKLIRENERGITLIALVITIIVLLVLAGVAITMLSGENGILKKAAQAKEKTGMASEEEQTKLDIMDIMLEYKAKGYKYLVTDKYLTNIDVHLLAEKFEFGEYTVNSAASGRYIGTGRLILKNEKEVLTIILYGDLNGDGQIHINDLSNMNLLLNPDTSLESYSDYQLIAADINHDGKINNSDKEILAEVISSGDKSKINQNVKPTIPVVER